MFPIYGEDLDVLFAEVRKKGCRRLIVDGKPVDLAEKLDGFTERMSTASRFDAVVDRVIVGPQHEKAIKAAIAATLLVGDGLLKLNIVDGASKAEAERFYKAECSATEHFIYGDIAPEYFQFNNPESACRTCGGLGVDKLTHPELLVPDPERSIRGGCFVREAFKYNPDTWDGRMMFSLATALELLARHAVEGSARRRRATRFSTALAPRRSSSSRRRTPRCTATTTQGRELAFRASPAASSATTGAIASRARPTRGWKSGSTR